MKRSDGSADLRQDTAQIADKDLYALSSMTSASAAMVDRRRRILREAQHMIAEGGIAEFSTMELSRRSGVAQRTIFNAFGNRDTVIALAIRSYFERFSAGIESRFDPATLEGALGRLAATSLRNIQIPNYMAAIVSLYFSPSVPGQVRAATLQIGASFFLPWLTQVQSSGQLQGRCNLERVTKNLASMQYAIVQEWIIGAIDKEVVVTCTLESVLLILGGAVKGSARVLVNRYQADLQRSGPLTTHLLAHAANEIAMLFKRQHAAD